MKKYENYKDSGLEWLGMVPEHWEILPFKRGVSVNNGRDYKHVKSEDGYPVIGSGGQFAYASDYLYDGEVILLGRKGTIDKPRYFSGKFWTVDTMFYAIPNQKCIAKYMYYQALTIPFSFYSTDTALPSMTQSDLGNHLMCFPPISEQRIIASYLDQKVGQIDALISEKEKMVEDLKAYRSSLITETVTKGLDKEVEMKDSGVEWIGKMPSKWTVSKLKYICKINGRIGFRGYTTDDLVSEGNGAFTIGGKHISKNLLDLSSPEYISWEKYYESPEIMVKKGDIVSAQRGTLGRTAYIDKEIGPATINPSLVLINDIIEDAKFLYWFMVSNSFLSIIEFVNTATAVPMISQTQFGNTLIPLPPISEQHIIVEYLEKEISKIDTSISEIEHQLSDLKSYKSSLITEAVTGKIDLRDWQTKKS